ncbi:MAG: SlyX family protein [Thermodesulfobacteriota bacterium]
MEDRIVNLEAKAAFNEKTIDELNDVIVDQQKQIDDLNTQMDRLQKQVIMMIRSLTPEQRPNDILSE